MRMSGGRPISSNIFLLSKRNEQSQRSLIESHINILFFVLVRNADNGTS